MKVEPLRRYSWPLYPTRDYLNDHPELLNCVPERWRKNAVVLAALGTAAMLLASCQSSTSESAAQKLLPKSPVVQLAGLFPNPPTVMLTEADARRCVENEAEPEGICFERGGMAFTSVLRSMAVDSTADGYDRGHNVAYELSWDRDRMERGDGSPVATPQADTGRPRAMAIFNLATQPTDYYVVTASGKWEVHMVSPDRAARRDSITEADLRLQVRDFIAWLKADGII